MNKIILFLLLVPTSFLIGQNVQIPQNIPTPNASSLGKYGDVPVSYYTGKVNVNVPIFSLNENNIPLKLSLNYDTGGVKVNELPSWIGQNWNMEAGGVIVRTTKGKGVDELFFDSSWGASHFAQKGYLYNYDLLNVSNWADQAYLKTLVPNDRYDFEPDLFTFNFLGHTGTFFFSQDGTWKVKSDSNLKVEINLADNVLTLGRTTQCMSCNNNAVPPKSIGKITITDEQGNRYIFGNNANAIEYAHNNFFDYYGSLAVATAWYLTGVIDRLGNQVYTFEYDRGDYQAYFYLNQMYSKKQKYKNDSFATFLGKCANPSRRANTVGSNLLVPSFLKKITTLGGVTINFSRSTSKYKYYTPEDADNVLSDRMYEWSSAYDPLSNSYQTDFYLLIHDANDQMLPLTDEKGNTFGLAYLLNKAKFSQLDAISISDKTTTKYTRLIRNTDLNERLNLIRLENGNYVNGSWVAETSYKFEYNNFSSLPYYLSRAIDHWGYYKGTNYGNSFFNNEEADKYASHYDTRKPDPNYLQIGSLKKIIYPTSGYTEFTYEPHSYSSYVNDRLELTAENDIAGGLRIQKITNFDGIKENVKSFKYTTDISSNTSSGILALKNRYYVEWRTYTEDHSVYLEKNFSINNLIPLSNFLGSHIAYSKVFEIEEGNGYKEFQYSSYKEYPDVPYTQTLSYSHSIFDEKNSNDFKRGALKQLTFYDEQKNKLKEQINIYESIGTNRVRGFNFDFICPCCPEIFELVKAGNAYEREYSDFKLTSSQEIDYFNNKLINSNKFTYKKYPVDINFYGSTYLESETNEISNYSKSKKYKYPFDYVGSLETSMLTKNFVPIIETLSLKDSDIIFKQKNLYAPLQINGQKREMLTSTQTAKSDITYENDKIIDLYDNRGNVIQYHNNNGRFTTFIWGYNKTKIIAKIENATYTQIATALAVLTTVLDTYSETNLSAINSLRNNSTLSSCMINTYTYIPLVGMTSMTDPKGISTYYEYDRFNRLMLVKDQDLNVLQKYCYGYKGQQVDCENDDPYGVSYKSIARSGSFIKNNCPSGGIGSAVVYSQSAGAVKSTISQADADAKGLAKYNTEGQANANADASAFCTFSSIAQSGSFTRNNCATGGIAGAVTYSQAAGAVKSTVSQADADANGVVKFNNDGQAYANTSGTCTFSSAAQSGAFTRNNCGASGVAGSINYSQNAGAETSALSQEDADAKGLAKFNIDGQAYANISASCTYSSIAQSGSFIKNNCPVGAVGSSVAFSQVAGVVTSNISQADADSKGLAKFNTEGQANANADASAFCTFSSTAQSGLFTRNNCVAGGIAGTVTYSQAAGAVKSTVSQADADANGVVKFNTDGQTYANTTATCTFNSIAQSGSFIRNNCAAGGVASSVVYNQPLGVVTSTLSQADADAKGTARFNIDGQTFANNNGSCTFSSVARSGSFVKNNCASGGVGSSVAFSQAAGAVTSTLSQADADANGFAKFNIDGQANANAIGTCTFSSIARSGSFTKNNCAAGGIASSVTYSQATGAVTSTVSQASADANGDLKFNTDGQAYANANGTCTFRSIAYSGPFTRDNCSEGMVGSTVTYTQTDGAVTSLISQANADFNGLTLFNGNGRKYARAVGTCYYASVARTGSFRKMDCPQGYEGSLVSYSQPAGAVTSTASQAAADADGLSKFNYDGVANANVYGACSQLITFVPRWNPVNKALAVVATASTSVHNGLTLRFMVNYKTSVNNMSQPLAIFIAAGKTSAGVQIYLQEAKETPIVELIAIERN